MSDAARRLPSWITPILLTVCGFFLVSFHQNVTDDLVKVLDEVSEVKDEVSEVRGELKGISVRQQGLDKRLDKLEAKIK